MLLSNYYQKIAIFKLTLKNKCEVGKAKTGKARRDSCVDITTVYGEIGINA